MTTHTKWENAEEKLPHRWAYFFFSENGNKSYHVAFLKYVIFNRLSDNWGRSFQRFSKVLLISLNTIQMSNWEIQAKRLSDKQRSFRLHPHCYGFLLLLYSTFSDSSFWIVDNLVSLSLLPMPKVNLVSKDAGGVEKVFEIAKLETEGFREANVAS